MIRHKLCGLLVARPPTLRLLAPRCQLSFSSSSSPSPSPGFDPDNGKIAFQHHRTTDLVLALGLLELCRFRPLVEVGARVCNWAAEVSRAGEDGQDGQGSRTSAAALLATPLLWAVRHTTFKHFNGGETLQECFAKTESLARYNVKSIVDHGVEEATGSNAWNVNCERKVEVLRDASEALGTRCAFMPLKLTALLSPSLLERLTATWVQEDGSLVFPATDAELLTDLSDADARLLEEALARLDTICAEARDRGVPLLLDAEQSTRQPAVHLLAQALQRRFNRGGQCVVYDTFQMYLEASPGRLEGAMQAAKEGGYAFAVKLVRGAYVEQERAAQCLQASKTATDEAYDAAAARLLQAVTDSSDARVALLLATHNRKSLELAVEQMDKLGLPPQHERIHFAQILGMVDNLTNSLGAASYNATKLVVFGEVVQVLPWLMRRVQENRDAFGAQAAELHVLRNEVFRRLSPFRG